MQGVQVTVKEDPVIKRVIRSEATRLSDEVQDAATLGTAWIILHQGGRQAPLDSETLRLDIKAKLADKDVPHRLVYEAWDTFRVYLEPPVQPSPATARAAALLDNFFNTGKRNTALIG